MKYIYCILVCVFLSACNTSPSKPLEVLVPISTKCNIELPNKPDFALGNLGVGEDIFTQVKTLLAEREQRKGYELELETAIQECNK